MMSTIGVATENIYVNDVIKQIKYVKKKKKKKEIK